MPSNDTKGFGQAGGKDDAAQIGACVSESFAHSASKMKLGAQQALVIGVFAALLLFAVFIPNASAQSIPDKSIFLVVIVALLAVFIIGLLSAKEDLQKTTDIFLIMGILLLAWEVLLGKFALLDPFLSSSTW